jgi:hypothetical protein
MLGTNPAPSNPQRVENQQARRLDRRADQSCNKEIYPFRLYLFHKGAFSMFPIIPILALFAIIGGGATLVWYEDLSRDEKERADRLANQYASELFGKAVKELTKSQADSVHSMVRRHFNN